MGANQLVLTGGQLRLDQVILTGSQEEPGRSQEEPGGARRSQEEKPGGARARARRSQEEPEPGGARRSQSQEPGGARRSHSQNQSQTKPDIHVNATQSPCKINPNLL